VPANSGGRDWKTAAYQQSRAWNYFPARANFAELKTGPSNFRNCAKKPMPDRTN